MPDQADILRHLVAGALRTSAVGSRPSPPMVAIAGAKGGVGATTVAANLAIALAGQGRRVALVDVDFCRPDVALHFGLTPRNTTGDVLCGNCELHEALIAGPVGTQVAAGAWASPNAAQTRPSAQHRLIEQLHRLGGHVDVILLDVGCDIGETAQCYWQAADRVLLVATPDSVAIMDAYAAVKVAGTSSKEPLIDIVFNKLATSDDPLALHHRIDHSSQRFLGFGLGLGGVIHNDGLIGDALRKRVPLSAYAPESTAAADIDQIASHLQRALASPGTASASVHELKKNMRQNSHVYST